MTNGEKIKEIFSNMRITVGEFYVQVMGEKYEFNHTYPLNWWNAEYKESTIQERQVESDKFDAAFQNGYNNVYAQARLEPDNCGNYVVQEPTTKNDLAVEETNMIDKSNFSQEQYKSDLQSAYDCGYAQAKNDLEVDCISRKKVLKLIYDYKENHSNDREHYPINYGTLLDMIRWVRDLPSVTPQEPQTFKWCTGCREYDQEKHCCPRWSKVIRDTVEEMKKEYIEREVLDKIRAEVENINVWGMRYNPDTDKDRKPQIVQKVKEHVIEILDKYKAETEET